MDLHFNPDARFTRWVVREGLLREPFVVVDVGVQGGEHPRWHVLGDHLVVHGFDAIAEVAEALREQNAGAPNRRYHWSAIGSADEERTFYVRPEDPFSSSFDRDGARADEARRVPVRRLDTLLAEGAIPPADFLKIDVEGFEKHVLLGARALLGSVLGLETETSFHASPDYPKGHFGTLAEMALEHHLVVFDLNFDRAPRPSFARALARAGLADLAGAGSLGRPATVNALFCRDLVAEVDAPDHYLSPPPAVGVDRLIKQLIVYELHGFSDVALDAAERFADRLGARLEVAQALRLLADPYCREPDGRAGAERRMRARRHEQEERAAFVARIRYLESALHAERAAAVARIRELEQGMRDLEGQMSAMRRTLSWRCTAPLRELKAALRRLVSRRRPDPGLRRTLPRNQF